MQIQLATDDIDREGEGAGDVFPIDAGGQAVGPRVPGDDDALARGWIALQQMHQVFNLVTVKVFAPAVAIGGGNNAVDVGKFIPNMGELRQEIVSQTLACQEPDLFGNED